MINGGLNWKRCVYYFVLDRLDQARDNEDVLFEGIGSLFFRRRVSGMVHAGYYLAGL